MTENRHTTSAGISEVISRIPAVQGNLRSEASKQHDQWRLFLTGGNGGGLLAISAILITEAGARWTDALLCAAWLFALGMISASVLPLLQAAGGRGLSEIVKAIPPALSPDKSKSEMDELNSAVQQQLKRIKMAGLAERVLEPLSALSFLAALLVPLVSFSFFGR